MSVEQYAVRQDGMFVAKVDIPESDTGRVSAHRDAMHYMAVYGQDGPVELWYRSRHRKWRNLTGRGFSTVSADELARMHAFGRPQAAKETDDGE